MTLKDLIVKAQGLKEDAYVGRGIILRNKEDLTPEVVSFSPLEVIGPAVVTLFSKQTIGYQ
jgi:hypothetical protein